MAARLRSCKINANRVSAMRFWSSRALINDIKNSGLSQKDIARYWVLSSILYWLMFGLTVGSVNTASFPYNLKNIFSVISLLISVLGFTVCYRSNGGASGERLLDKFTALFFVASIRGFAFAWLPFLFVFSLACAAIYYPGGPEPLPVFAGSNLAVLFYKSFVYLSIARNLKVLDIRSND